jgi:UDP-N-acetylglucosamine diphosphorylase / glucose-1-phosphate thymidylyltransferase / UDP-N-acetylgalactosamine diphosphorylase / glucosamine-1-phosphate N-acetyltransferase / galactosamine-1-phosphate N-acetyltransferase
MAIVLFDDTSREKFYPISLTRALFDIKIGCLTPFENSGFRQLKLLTDSYLKDVTKLRHVSTPVNEVEYDKGDLYLNSLFFIKAQVLDKLIATSDEFILVKGNTILAARIGKLDSEYFVDCITKGRDIDMRKLRAIKKRVDDSTELGDLHEDVWDLISSISETLSMQLTRISRKATLQKKSKGRIRKKRLKGLGPLFIHEDSLVDDATVFDTGNGGIFIGPGSVVSQSTIYGPTFIGEDTQIKPYSIIGNSYIGKNCRLAGEIDSSTILDFTNKSHSGYVGHSYIGEWVNMGANTTTSDLKMTYGPISMLSYGKKNKINTHLIKLGSFFGDMVKTSIGTNIYGGLKLGISSHLHGFITQDVPSFVISGEGIGAENVEMELDSAVRTQERMMSRRNLKLSSEYQTVIESVFKRTAADRLQKKIKSKKFRI